MTVTTEEFKNGISSTTYAFTFPYYKTSDVKVAVWNASTNVWDLKTENTTGQTDNDYWIDGGNVKFNSNPTSGTGNIHIYRETDVDTSKATFAAGSSIRATDLNNNETQLLYAAQERQGQKILASDIKAGSITSTQLADNAVISSKILDGTIVNADVNASAAIAGTKISPNFGAQAVSTSGNLSAGATTITGNIAVSGNVDGRDVAADGTKLDGIETAATADQTAAEIKTLIATAPLDASHLAANSVTTSELAANAVEGTKIAADAVNGDKIADNSIDSDHYVDGSIDSAHIGNDQINSQHYAAGSIDNEHMSADSIDSAQYVDGSIDRVHIAGLAISADKIDDNAIINSKIATSTIEASSLQNGCVTEDKIGTGQVTNTKIGDLAVTTGKIYGDAITGDKIADDQVDQEHIADNAVRVQHIHDNAVSTPKIADAELRTLAGSTSGTASIIGDSSKTLTANIDELNLLDGKSIVTSISGNATDVQLPSAQAVNERIVELVTEVGGFHPIANETSFPSTNPDINDGAGTIVSIKALASAFTLGSGVTTKVFTNGAGSGVNVTVNGLSASTTYPAGRGMLLETTSTLHTYNFHRLTLDETGVADAQAAIDDFDERYYGPLSAAPSTRPGGGARADGDMYFDTAADKMKVWNNSATAWDDVATSASSFISTLSPAFDGSETEFTASSVPVDAQSCIISINGVIQKPNSGTSTPSEGYVQLANDKIKFAAAPQTGADYFMITLGNAVSIGTPSPNTVGASQLQSNAVEEAKIATGAVTTTKLADDSVSNAKLTSSTNQANRAVSADTIQDNAVVRAAIIADAIDGTKIADDAVGAEHIEDLDASVKFLDSKALVFGTDNDLRILHDGTDNVLTSDTGSSIRLVNHLTGGNETLGKFISNAAVELYYNGSKKFNTHSNGAEFHGTIIKQTGTGETSLRIGSTNAGGSAIYFDGDSDGDFAGSDYSWIRHTTAGSMEIVADNPAGTGDVILKTKGGSYNAVNCWASGAVELRYENVKKLETTSSGVKLTTSTNGEGIEMYSSGSTFSKLKGDANRASENQSCLYIEGNWNGTAIAAIDFVAGPDTTNKDDGHIKFQTTPSGSSIAERMRITSDGNVGIGTTSPNVGSHTKALTISNTASGARTALEIIGNTANCHGAIDFKSSSTLVSAINSRGTDRLQFCTGSSGNVKAEVTGDNFKIEDGNLVIGTSGHGIDFSATGGPTNGSSSSQLFTDYEEGSFTPTFGQGYTSLSYHHNTGYYRKIGKTVWFSIYFYVYQATGTSDHVKISGLPYTTSNTTRLIGGANSTYDHNWGSTETSSDDVKHSINWHIGGNSTDIWPYIAGATALIGSNTGLGSGANNTYLYLVGQYFTDI